MLVTDVGTKYVGDVSKMLVTVLAIFVTYAIFGHLSTYASATNIKKMSPTPPNRHQHHCHRF